MARGDANFKTGNSEEPEQERTQTSEDQKEQIGEMLSKNPEEESREEPENRETHEEEETRTREESQGEETGTSEEEETRTREEPEGEETDESESEEEELSTEQQLRDELNEVYGTIEELKEQIQGEQTEGSEEETEEGEAETQTSQEDLDVQDRQFVTDEEIESFQDDPSKINDFLNRVFQESLEEAMRRIPNVVTSKVSRNMTMRERAKEFYKENSDLQEYRDFVGHVANEVQSNNPEMDIQEVFNKTATEARKRLGIKKKAQDTEEQRRKGEEGQGPAFAGKPRGSRKGSGKDARDDQQKQIDKMLDT